MQQQIAETGTHQTHYHCSGCPNGCDTYDRVQDGGPEIFHNHACHRYPSRSTEYVKVRG